MKKDISKFKPEETQSFDIMLHKNLPDLLQLEETNNKPITVDEIRGKYIVGSREYKKGRR